MALASGQEVRPLLLGRVAEKSAGPNTLDGDVTRRLSLVEPIRPRSGITRGARSADLTAVSTVTVKVRLAGTCAGLRWVRHNVRHPHWIPQHGIWGSARPLCAKPGAGGGGSASGGRQTGRACPEVSEAATSRSWVSR